MSLSVTFSRACNGVLAPLVTVEVHLSNGLPSLSMVGLPELAVRESKERVRAALINCRFEFPTRRITVNLAPADLPKDGGRFDLPIALGVLAASGQIPGTLIQDYEFLGELALSGHLRTTRGVLPAALAARDNGRKLIVAQGDAKEAALVQGAEVYPADHLLAVCGHLNGTAPLTPQTQTGSTKPCHNQHDLADVRGQFQAKRALEVAAAGSHSLLMIGPPGSGKSMLANRFPSILPAMTEREALETATIYSISKQPSDPSGWLCRPFRAPHHTASAVALVGGASPPRPGEVSLAHNGVLFLDELAEFDRRVLEVLREPLEAGSITISRAAQQTDFPARFLLLAAMNPCPCGYLGDESGRCRCTAEQVQRYQARLSGPLMDRIDMHIEVPKVAMAELTEDVRVQSVSSAATRARVEKARLRALPRGCSANAGLAERQIESCCRLDRATGRLMQRAMDNLGLSARAYHRILRVARTIADLDEAEDINSRHLSEAIGYRRLDRRNPAFGGDGARSPAMALRTPRSAPKL